MKFALAAAVAALAATTASAQVNIGAQKPEASLPFTLTKVATFNYPWRIAFLPDGRMLITEKPGALQLVTQAGAKTPVANVRPCCRRDRAACWASSCRPITPATT